MAVVPEVDSSNILKSPSLIVFAGIVTPIVVNKKKLHQSGILIHCSN